MQHRWRLAPLWAHAAALAMVLLGLVAVIDPGWSYSADEGAAVIQARSLSRGDGWLVEHPLREADPGSDRYPFELSEWGAKGIAPYAKHPLYPVLLAGADRAAGTAGMVALSALGTVGAAWVGARLARRVRPGTELPTFWVLGLLSPLCFDGLWVIAHSLAAALVGLAVLAALRAVDAARPWAWSASSGLAVGLGVALRTEVAFVAGALVLVALRRAWSERSRAWAATAIAVATATVVVRLAEREALRAIVGSPRTRPEFGSDSGGSFLGDRWAGFVQTWLSPDAGDDALASVLLVAATLFAAVVLWQLLRRTPDPVLLRGAAVLFAVLVVLRLVVAPATAVPGLLVAFPLLWLGLLAGRGAPLHRSTGRLLAGVAGLGAAGVLATQYRSGGSAEWGGRYFAVLLPLAVPLAVAGLAAAGERLDRSTARLLGGALLVGSLALTSLAVLTLRSGHRSVERGMRFIAAGAQEAGPDLVVVTTDPALPRLGWRSSDRLRWLLIDTSRDQDAARALARAGIGRFLLVSPELDRTMEVLGVARVPSRFDTAGTAVVDVPGANMRS